MKTKAIINKFSFESKFLPDYVMDELEGAFLGVTKTFRELGIDVKEGFTSNKEFVFYLGTKAEKRWEDIVKILLGDMRGYVLRIGTEAYLEDDEELKYRRTLRLTSDKIIVAASNFRKSLYFAWETVKPRSSK